MAKSALTKTQRAYMGDTMDSVGRLFEFEQLSFEAFEQCRTAGDIADYLYEEMGRWIKIEADSSTEEYTACLESFNRDMRYYLRKPVTGEDLYRPLTELFARKRRRIPINKIDHWFYILRSKFSRSVPELTRRPWVRPAARSLWTGYWIMLVGVMIVSVFHTVGVIELPESMLLWGILLLVMLSPFVSITVTAFLPSRFFYANPEPDLTLRDMLARYARKLRELHGECDLEYIQSQLLKNWDSESCEPSTLESPVPWLNK